MLLPEYVERMRSYLGDGDTESADALKSAQGKEMVTFQEAEEVISQDTIMFIEYISRVEQLSIVSLSVLLEILAENEDIKVPKETREVLLELTSILEEEEGDE